MKEEKINEILAVGTELVLKKGFNNVGIQEILDAVNIPKGSFYHYFKSKEDFGLKIIGFYSNNSLQLIKKYLTNQNLTPRERIMTFFEDNKQFYIQKGFMEGCLLGNCSLELSDISDSYSQAIAHEFNQWQQAFEKCIIEGQELNTINPNKSANDLANFILFSWEGALLKMKATKSVESLDVYIHFLDELLN